MILKMDDLGRVLVPKAVRLALGFQKADYVEASLDERGQTLTLSKIKARCIICGSYENLTPVKGRFICADCGLRK